MTTSRERMALAMRHVPPDRVPLMCQLALGHYFLQSGLDAVEIWHDGAAFAEALVRLQQRYRFDGILVNLPGREPGWRGHLARAETHDGETHLVWRHGRVTVCPADDNPHVFLEDRRTRPLLPLAELDPERLFYLEPHDLLGPTSLDAFPRWHWDTLRRVRAAAPDVSVHGEVFSPFSQLCEACGVEEVLMALRTGPGRLRHCLESLCEGTIALARGHVEAGADAVLVSSAYAGGGLIGRDHYRDFVLPFERRVVSGFKSACPGVPIYTHTCGAIGDRLELLEATGTDGIDTLDPPPLGDVDLEDAKRRVGGRLFIRGNVDPVGTVLLGTPRAVFEDAVRRIGLGKPGGGYILSTACSVPPRAPAANVAALHEAAEAAGWY